jgi:hypothetical protein
VNSLNEPCKITHHHPTDCWPQAGGQNNPILQLEKDLKEQGHYYWNEGHHEVDFVIEKNNKIIAIEVKSGRKSRSLNGLNLFLKKCPQAKPLLVGAEGIPVEKFLRTSLESWYSHL